jgi:2-methylcitrate dehydratase PrpD
MPDPAPTVTAELARFLAGLSGRVAPRLTRLAVDRLLDTVGAMVFGATQPWSRAAAGHALAVGGSGPATVVGTDRTTTPPMAAFANGSAAHAFELDDVHEEAISHPGAVVVPAALALAEELDATGRDLLEAVVIGYEAMGRAGIAVGPASHMLGGFHPTSMSGVFGAAAAAGRLLGFDADQLNQAFGLATTLASGTMEFAASGGMAKRIHAGRAAEGGLTAALLVSRGLEGATDGLAGRYGFCRVFTDEPRVERLTDRLGERWMIDEITVKPYAACSDIHPMIQAAMELRDEHGIRPEQVERIEAEGPTKAAEQNSMDGTVSVMAAQYSAEFNIAAALLGDPTDPATYQADRIGDPSLAELQDKVASVKASPEFDSTYAWKMGGRVHIALVDGTVLERTVHGQKGSMHAPLSGAELEAKFESLVSGLVAPGLAGIITSIATLTAADLGAALRPTR